MQSPDTWSVSGELEGVRITGLSHDKDNITAELYDSGTVEPMIGAVALQRDVSGVWYGLDEIVAMVRNRGLSQ